MSTAQKSLLGSNDQLPILAPMEAAMKSNGGISEMNNGVIKTLENTNGDVLNPNRAVLNPEGTELNPNGAVAYFRDRQFPVLSSINGNPGNAYISPYEGTGFLSSTGSSILESVARDQAPGKAQNRGATSEDANGSHLIAVGWVPY